MPAPHRPLSPLPTTPEREPPHAEGKRPWTLQCVDLGLSGIVVAVPLLSLGQRAALGELCLCLLVTFTACAWCVHQWKTQDSQFRVTGVEPVLLIAVGLVILQCLQLSPSLLHVLSPHLRDFLPEPNVAHAGWLPEEWNRISLAPHLTQSSLTMVIAAAMFFLVAVQRLRTIRDLCRAVRWIAAGGGVLAVLGLLEAGLRSGALQAMVGQSAGQPIAEELAPRGPFLTPSHFAHILCLTLPAQLFLFTHRFPYAAAPATHGWRGVWQWISGQRTTAWGASLLMTALVIMLTCELAPIWMACMGSVVYLVLCWRKLSRNVRTLGTVTGVALLVWCAMLMISRSLEGIDEVVAGAAPTTQDAAALRAATRTAELSGIKAFPLFGTGLGSHDEVCWLWFRQPYSTDPFQFKESSYVRLGLETGLTGAGIVLLLAVTAILWSAQGMWNASTPRAIGLMSAVTVGLVVGLLHAATDSTFYVVECVIVLLLYSVCAWRMSLMRFCESTGGYRAGGAPRRLASPFVSLAAIPLVLGIGGWLMWNKLPEVAAEPLRQEYRQLSDNTAAPRDAAPTAVAAKRYQLAVEAAAANPRDHRLQLSAGLACLRLFELASQSSTPAGMPLLKVKELARATIDSPREMQDWLRSREVLGERAEYLESAYHHFRRSLRACPVQSRPYLELAELVWLQGGVPKEEDYLISQAVTVRPGDARARFALGRALWRAGNRRDAIGHWREGYRLDVRYRTPLIASLAQVIRPRDFLEQFEPDHEALRQLYLAYQKSEDRFGYRSLVVALANSTVKQAGDGTDVELEDLWMLAHQCYAELGDRANALTAAQRALSCNPDSFDARQAAGTLLYQLGQYPQAAEHLNWCSQRRPDLTTLVQLAHDATARAAPAQPPTVLVEAPGGVIR